MNAAKKIMMACLLSVTLWISMPVVARADTFAGEIKKVPSSSTETVFVFTFSSIQDYDVTLISPTGEYYNVSASAKEVRIPVEKTNDGTYYYKIFAEDMEFSYDVNVINSDKIVATVGESKPSVSENVTALQIWFENGELVASWVYQGKVNLTVTDPSKMNRIANEKEYTKNKFRLPIPEGTETVQFFIVPSTDSKVAGSGLTYTLEVIRDIKAEIVFPQESLVNWDRVQIPVSVKEDGITMKAYVNTFTIGDSNCNDGRISPVVALELEPGTKTIDIPLVSVTNNIVIAFMDKKGNANLYSRQYIRDMQYPTIDMKKLSVNNEIYSTGYFTDKETAVITGTVKDEIATGMVGGIRSFTIDGARVELDENGRFTYEHVLTVIGNNELELVATDESGNQTKITINLERREKQKTPVVQNILTGLVIIILVLGTIYLAIIVNAKAGNPLKKLIEKYKSKSNEDDDDDDLIIESTKDTPKTQPEPNGKDVKSDSSAKKKHGKSVAELRKEIEEKERQEKRGK